MLTVHSDDLPPTATYAKRSYAWVSDGSGSVTFDRVARGGEVVTERVPALGKLTIKLQPAATGWGRAIEVDVYAVDEAEPEQPGTRLFVLLNLTDPEQPEPYRVTVGGMNRCRCQAGKCRVPSGCKHRDALTALIAEGLLEPAGALLAT